MCVKAFETSDRSWVYQSIWCRLSIGYKSALEVLRYILGDGMEWYFDWSLIGHAESEGKWGSMIASKVCYYLVEHLDDVANLPVKKSRALACELNPFLWMTHLVWLSVCVNITQWFCPKRLIFCYATQNRQRRSKTLAKEINLVLVVGSVNSLTHSIKELLLSVCGESFPYW